MRFSPLTRDHAGECRPAQSRVGVSHAARRLVAPAGEPAAARQAEPACAVARRAGRPGRHARSRARRTRRLGLPSERGHAARHQRHDVPVDAVLPRRRASTRRRAKKLWAFQLPGGQPVDARRRILARRRADPAADRLRLERRQAVLAGREDRQAERGFRRQRHRQSEYARDPARAARAATGSARRRSSTRTSSSPAARRRRIRRRARPATCARGTCTRASWSWTFHSIPARRREVQRHLGAATAGRTAPA